MFHMALGFIVSLFAATQAPEPAPIPPVDPAAPPAVRITIEANLPDDTPATDIPVYEVGLDRGYIRYGEIGKTDAVGHFTIPFQRGRESDDAKSRGYGLYRYVLMPPAHAWAVSDFYCWNEYPEGGPAAQPGGVGNLYAYDTWFAPDYDGQLKATDPADNWSYGKGVALFAGKDVKWPVRLKVGESVELTVVDQDGLYIPEAELNIGIDLRARTRTGYGGYIPITYTRTNGKGVVRLDHAGDFAYNFAIVSGDIGEYIAPNAYYYRSDIDHNIARQRSTLRFQRLDPIYLQFQVRDADSGQSISSATTTSPVRDRLFAFSAWTRSTLDSKSATPTPASPSQARP
ncbi:MAG: hypothetical protein JNK74_10590 [Candidatus Hydrogenedentes bacterium]|nr:hypothetical protein [Candidatus Hydrogenedentota bacterium]